MRVSVEIEEDVYSYLPPENGAGPMWCHGNTCICRVGELVYAAGIETLPDAKPLHNCVPLLWRRTDEGWRRVFRHERRTREPSPLCAFPDGRVFLSLNPTLAADDAYDGPAEPLIAEFAAGCPKEPRMLRPRWNGSPRFTEHSYRSFAADGGSGELVLFHNCPDDTHAEFAFRDADGAWAAGGRLVWPWGAEYETPQPIRICYPTVQLSGRAVFFCGVSDIVEPRSSWRDFKRRLTGKDWDYDFRRLFYTWTDDIRAGSFHEWMEIASRERTCGGITPCDLYADDGTVHLLWTERAIDERLRDEFFPLERQSHCLHYAVISRGVVELRRLVARSDGGDGVPEGARFQATPDGRLLALYHLSGRGTLLREVSPRFSEPVVVPLAAPMPQFFTATVRGGSAPSHVIDILGEVGRKIRYARVRIA